MKKLMLLSLVVAFLFLGAQAFASPPITPPVEGFIIKSFTEAVVDPLDGKSSFTESEKFNWTYYEGWGQGPFYPNGYTPAGVCFGTGFDCNTGFYNPQGLVSELGFTEGAEVAYEQTFEAKDGHTEFTKTFTAKSKPEAGDNNLVVNKKIEFEADDPAVGYAKHTEKVGLSVISMGAKDGTISNPASGLLTLCPWAAQGSGTSVTGGGYPPTNEGIAAGSSFNVTRLVGFETNSKVNSSINPALSYDVTANSGDGTISAAFIVDLWEGPKGYVWAPVPLKVKLPTPSTTDDPNASWYVPNACIFAIPALCDQAAWISQGKSMAEWINSGFNPDKGLQVWQLPQYAYGEPPLASRLHYEEHASATGTWSFTKQVSYESTMPSTGTPAGAFPFNNVP